MPYLEAMSSPVSRPTDDWMSTGEGHPRRWAILSVLVVSLLVVVLDNTVLNIALPTIQRDLDASQGELVWAVDSYILAFAALLFTWGVIGDRIGRKRVLVIGLVVFGLASAACAFAESAGMLIGLRVLMGIGGAAVLPTTLAIITVVFAPHERGKAIGVWGGAVGAAVALGPVIGGVLLQHPSWSSWLTGNDWGSVFLINVPIVLVGVIAILRVVPETRNPHPRRFDVTGLLVSIAGLVLLVYGIIHASETKDWLAASVLVPVLLGIAILAGFVMLEARSDHSSFDVSLFRNRGYAISLTAVSLAFFAMSGITFSLPFYLQIIKGFDTLTAGLCFLPFAVGQLAAAPRSATLVLRFGYRAVITTGLVLVGLSLLGLTQVRVDTPVWVLLIDFLCFGLGMGLVIAPGSTVMQNVLPLERAGAGSAVQNTVRQVAGALGVAIIGTVLGTRYAANLEPAMQSLPPQVPDQWKAAASDSLVATNALLQQASAQGFPEPLIQALRSGAFEAFLAAAHAATLISLSVIVVAALVVGFGLPRITPPTRRTEAGQDAPPADAADALVQQEAEHYQEQAEQEYRARD